MPTPDNYIGADKIFGNGYEEDWHIRSSAKYDSSIIKILNDEQQYYYVFKHKKDLADELTDLPPSLYEAIQYFVLATAVSDLRFDNSEHRTMMVNVSRFTDVQNVTADLIESYLNQLKSDVENYSQLPIDKSMEIKNIQKLNKVWKKYCLEGHNEESIY